MLFIVFALFYFGLILVFALVYYGISVGYPMCINSNGSMIGHGEGVRIFGDCFHLSWTTFSTVVSLELISDMCHVFHRSDTFLTNGYSPLLRVMD